MLATNVVARYASHGFVCLLVVWVGLVTFSITARAQALSDQAAGDQARKIAQDLACPICEGLSVADSPSQLAVQMRGVIKDKIEAGETRDQILQYFVERYGENILMSPPRSGFTTIAWVTPYVAVLATFAFLGWKLRRRASRVEGPPATDADLEPYFQEVDRNYEAVRDEAIR